MANPAGGNFDAGTVYANAFVQGLNVAWGSTTTLTVSAGTALDSTNNKNIALTDAVTINAASVGLNGLDTGTLANSTWYYVYLLTDSLGRNPTGCILSTSSSQPTVPVVASGAYDAIRKIGYVKTDGSAHFLKFYTAGSGNNRQHFWDSCIAVLTTGTATSLTAVDISAAIPAVDLLPIYLQVAFTAATANDKVSFAAFGSTATVLPNISGLVAAKIQTGQLKVISKLDTVTPKILYINSAAACNTDASVFGFEYSI